MKIKPSEYPERMLKMFIEDCDSAPELYGGSIEAPYELLVDEFAIEAGILSPKRRERFEERKIDYPDWLHYSLIDGILGEMEQREWVRIAHVKGSGRDKIVRLDFTPKGIDLGRFLNRSWFYRKLWYPTKSDIRTVLVSAVSGAIAGAIIILIQRC